MKENYKLVFVGDFEETDEDVNILGVDYLNNSAALLIICHAKTILIHIKEFNKLSQNTYNMIINELKRSKFTINDIRLYIGSDCNTQNLQDFLDVLPPYTRVQNPYVNEHNIESIAYDELTGTTHGINQYGQVFIDYNSKQTINLKLVI